MLLGDAAHTAHFSIGSGTKLAMEDAVALAWAFRSYGEDVVRAPRAAYESERRPIVECTQRAAQASLEWFEGIGRYVEQERLQFAFNLLTRSRRVTYDNLRLRDPSSCRSVAPRSAAADVHAVAAAWAGAAQPGRGLADGHVLRGRRDAERLPPRAPRGARARRRRPGDDRDDLRLGHRHGSRLAAPACIATSMSAPGERIVSIRPRARGLRGRRPDRPLRAARARRS